MSSKSKQKARLAVPPPQSRGFVRQMPGLPEVPGGVRQEINELDAVKYRLAVAKDKGLQDQLSALEDKKKILAQEEEIIRLRINLTRMENQRDVGHLDIQQGDKLASENGKFFIQRAPRQGPIPQIKPPEQPPEPPEPEEPEEETPEQPPEAPPQDKKPEGSGAGEGAPEPPPAKA